MNSGFTANHFPGFVSWEPKLPRPNKYPVLLLHGWTGNARTFLNDTGNRLTTRWANRLAQKGLTLLSASLGDGFGAPSESIDVETMRTTAASRFPWCDSSKVVIVGISMGGLNAWAYRRDYPTRVAGILGIIAGGDLEDLRTRDPLAGSRAAADLAWGVTYPAPLPAAGQFPTLAPTLSGIPYRAYYSGGDTVMPPAKAIEWAGLVGGTAVQAGSAAHGDSVMVDVPVSDCYDFLVSCGA